MTFARALVGIAAVYLLSGCAGPLILYDTAGGRQWYWPHFLDGKPTVLAFWSTDEMQCLEDIPGLNTLNGFGGPVELVSVATGPDRQRIDDWVNGYYRHRMQYLVLVDQRERLARKLRVRNYPTYIFFDVHGREIERHSSLELVHKWFTREALAQARGGVGRLSLAGEFYWCAYGRRMPALGIALR